MEQFEVGFHAEKCIAKYPYLVHYVCPRKNAFYDHVIWLLNQL